MTILGLDHVNLRGPRDLLDALKDFYCSAVGLEVGWRPDFAGFGYWLYAGRQAVVHLSAAAPDEERRTDGSATFDHVAFACRDCRAAEARLQARGVAYTRRTVPGTGQVQLFLRDPGGNRVELVFDTDDGASR